MSISRYPVVHYRAHADGAELATRLVEYLNARRMRGRVNESGEIALVWEVADLDQLDAFLRDLRSTGSPGTEMVK